MPLLAVPSRRAFAYDPASTSRNRDARYVTRDAREGPPRGRSRSGNAALVAAALSMLAMLGCAAPGSGRGTGTADDPIDLGHVDSKADSATRQRQVDIDLGPGQMRWFRVQAIRYHAQLEQDAGDVPARLSTKHYDIELESDVSAEPELEAVADEEELRHWTLRVHNEGDSRLVGTLTIEAVEELDAGDGGVIREAELSELPPGETKWFRVRARHIHAELTQQADPVRAQLSARHYDVDIYGEPSTRPTVTAESPGDEVRNWTLRVTNLGDGPLSGRLTVTVHEQEPDDEEMRTGRPGLGDPVLYDNEWCTYADSPPYVRSVRWEHPDVKAAMRAVRPGWRSVFGYQQWNVPYGLESTRNGTDEEIRNKLARNFIRTICGEHRDYPEMIEAKLRHIAATTHYAGPEELTDVDGSDDLFTQLTYPAYERLTKVMDEVYSHRRRERSSSQDGYNYGFGEHGHGSKRVEHSVPPFTHCEMKFIFEHYLGPDAPSWIDTSRYEARYDDYRRTQCTEDDLSWMYNFRGHVNFQPLWLESNAFIFNSRRARGAEISRGDRSYYLRPFATRYAMARSAWATHLLYPEEDHDQLIRASERGGGPILYLTDQDTDGDHLQDYRLFDVDGCGDQGVGLPVPSQNCNMVSWEQAWHTDSTTGHVSSWDPAWFGRPDLGFFDAIGTFEQRMARFNQALDRHTNWGPTGYYMLDASDPGDRSPRFYGTYSPIVAASYEISKSDWFAQRDYSSTDSFERGQRKWMFVMKFPADRYYDEDDLRAGRPMRFDEHYFNETSLSNDYYRERALDHWGYIPHGEYHAQVYLTYGDRGERPPALEDVPPPPSE